MICICGLTAHVARRRRRDGRSAMQHIANWLKKLGMVRVAQGLEDQYV
jgi:hypothetical protein